MSLIVLVVYLVLNSVNGHTHTHTHTHIYIYIYIYIYLQGAYNKFPDFFCTGSKNYWRLLKIHYVIAIYVMRFMIFMILDSSEQLQQELEYTRLKPDYHSWWISKMQSDTLEEQYAIKFCFKLGKKCYRNVCDDSDCFWTLFHESSISFWVA